MSQSKSISQQVEYYLEGSQIVEQTIRMECDGWMVITHNGSEINMHESSFLKMGKLYEKLKAMPNYDDDVIGIGNSRHPANQIEAPSDYPDTIKKSLDYYKEHSDINPLLENLDQLENQMAKGKTIIIGIIKDLRSNGSQDLANSLCVIKDLFNYE